VKVCCIDSVDEARMAIRHGAAAIGLVSEMPSGPGVIPDERIAEIAAAIPPGVTSVLLTCRQDAESIFEQQRRCRVNAIQLCDRLDSCEYDRLRAALRGIALIQVVHVIGEESVAEARRIAPHVAAILLDAGNPAPAVRELGGTGRRHDWTISRRIRESIAAPLFLAGGLRPDNVADAIRDVGPYALDVCTGVRTAGRLDEGKLAAFFAAISGVGVG